MFLSYTIMSNINIYLISTGHYMYTESSKGTYKSTSTITSSPVKAKSAYCLTFMYHMYGAHIGQLDVIILIDRQQAKHYLKIEGEKGNEWLEEYVQILHMQNGQNFNVQFKATRGTGFAGDMAIDDVSLKEGLCSKG